MKYTTASAFRTALERRLIALARQTEIPLLRLRKLIVFNRFLARLVVISPKGWVLKGAVALQFRIGPRFRTTKDIDIGRQDGEVAATADLIAIQSVDLGDYFTFSIEKKGRLDESIEGSAIRYHVSAEVAGRPFEEITLDVGFGDPVTDESESVYGPDLLDFAGIPPVQVPLLPLTQHIAEKVHAYSRTYPGSRTSSRVKDLIDLVAAASLLPCEAGRLRMALETTFSNRATHPLPDILPLPPPEWSVPYRKMALELNFDPDMTAAYRIVGLFIGPILTGSVPRGARWEPIKGKWEIDTD